MARIRDIMTTCY